MSKQKYTLSARNLSVADKRAKSTRFSYPGVILRIGASGLTNDTIATIAILNSTNRKTGDMVQIYYLPVNIPPTEAVKTGADRVYLLSDMLYLSDLICQLPGRYSTTVRAFLCLANRID